MSPHIKVFSTCFGQIALVWNGPIGQPTIRRIILSNETMNATQLANEIWPFSAIASCERIDLIADQINQFLNGADIRFSLEILDWDFISPFQKQVLLAEHCVPRGSVTTYQGLATYIGRPKAARAVGQALKHNPFPIIIPCHRAIRSDGTVAGFQGGRKMKQTLLEQEGIRFSSNGKVVTATYFHSPKLVQ